VEFDTLLTDELIEKLIIKKVMTDKAYMVMLCDIFDKRYFDDDVRKVLKVAKCYYEHHEKLPTIRVMKHLIEKTSERDEDLNMAEIMSLISESISIDTGLDDKCIEYNVLAYIKSRASYYAISDSLTEIDRNKDTSKCIDRLSKIETISINEEVGTDLFEDQDRIWDALLSDDARLSFGENMGGLDRVTNGGVYTTGRVLICFLARTNLGKSLFLSNFAKNYASVGKNVLIVSLEMSEIVYSRRLMAHISEDNIDTLKQTAESTKAKVKAKYKDGGYGKIITKEFAPKTISANSIANEVDKLLVNGIKIDVILLDYLSLLIPAGQTYGSSYEDVGRVAEEVRALSYKYEVPVITVVQTNRTGYDNSDVDLSSISESAKIAMTADFVLSLYQDDELRDQGLMAGRTLKNRLGGYIGQKLLFKLNPYNLIISSADQQDDDDDGIDDILNDESPINNEPVVDVDMNVDVHNI